MTTTIIKRKQKPIDGCEGDLKNAKKPQGFLDAVIKSAEKVETVTILVDIQRAIDELRSEENSGHLSDVLLANSRAQAILSHILKRFE